MLGTQIHELLDEIVYIRDLVYGHLVLPRSLLRSLAHLAELDPAQSTVDQIRATSAEIELLFQHAKSDSGQELRASPVAQEVTLSLEHACRLAEVIKQSSTFEIQQALASLRDDTQNVDGRLTELIRKSNILERRVARLQASYVEEPSGTLTELLRRTYEDWYTQALVLISAAELKSEFSKEYEGTWRSSKIKSFFAAPRQRSFLLQQDRLPASDFDKAVYWQFPYDRTFEAPIRAQVLLLKQELQLRSTESRAHPRDGHSSYQQELVTEQHRVRVSFLWGRRMAA